MPKYLDNIYAKTILIILTKNDKRAVNLNSFMPSIILEYLYFIGINTAYIITKGNNPYAILSGCDSFNNIGSKRIDTKNIIVGTIIVK